MNALIRRYQKPILAFFMVLLMMTFLLTSSVGRSGNGAHGNGNDTVAGDIGGTKIYTHELAEAAAQWQWLSSVPVPDQDPTGPQQRMLTSILGSAQYEIDRDRATFLLLQKEAAQMGLKVNSDLVDSIAQQLPQADDDEHEGEYKAAFAGLLLVQEELQIVRNAVKVSQPQVQYAMATTQQQISLKVVEFNATDYLPEVASPTAQAIANQYDKFNSNLPAQYDPINDPLGFGYKYPDRIRFDYVAVNHDDVKKSIVASKPDVEWKAQALRYIRDNPDQFPSTAPTTGPTTQASASAIPGRPTNDQIQQAYDTVIDQAVDAQVKEITTRISGMMSTDYVAWKSAMTAGTADPNSTLGVPYDGDEYLRRLAASIQEQYGLLPTIAFIHNNWKSEQDLASEPGIGLSHVESEPQLSFPQYAIHYAAAFVPDAQKASGNTLALQQPSQPLNDDLGSDYIFRITETSPSAAAPQDEVEAQAKDDLRIASAFNLAEAEAQAMAQKCVSSAALPIVAKAAHKTIISTGLFQLDGSAQSVPGLSLKQESIPQLMQAAANLLLIDPQTNALPAVQVVRLDPDRKWLVIALDQVHPLWTTATEPMLRSQVNAELHRELQDQVAARWCNPQSVILRMNYHPAPTDKTPA
jgi:hypothetical protein